MVILHPLDVICHDRHVLQFLPNEVLEIPARSAQKAAVKRIAFPD
jgi:hypothetical protein